MPLRAVSWIAKTLIVRTPEIITVTVLIIEQFSFSVQSSV